MVEDLGHDIWDFGDVLCFCRELREGFDSFDLIELLEVATADVRLVAGARDHDHRPNVGHGIGKAREAVDAAWTGYGEKNTGAAGEVAEGGSGIAGGLLVVEGDEANAKGNGTVGEGGDGDANHAEHVVHAKTSEGLGG